MPAGERLIHAAYGMRVNVIIKPPHASSGTFVNYAEGHIANLLALVRRVLMPKRCNVVCHTGEPTIGASGHPYSAFQSHNEPWNPGAPTVYQNLTNIKPPRRTAGAVKK